MRAIPLPAVGGQGYGVGRLLLTRTAPSAIRAGLSWRGARDAGERATKTSGALGRGAPLTGRRDALAITYAFDSGFTGFS